MWWVGVWRKKKRGPKTKIGLMWRQKERTETHTHQPTNIEKHYLQMRELQGRQKWLFLTMLTMSRSLRWKRDLDRPLATPFWHWSAAGLDNYFTETDKQEKGEKEEEEEEEESGGKRWWRGWRWCNMNALILLQSVNPPPPPPPPPNSPSNQKKN